MNVGAFFVAFYHKCADFVVFDTVILEAKAVSEITTSHYD
jgi:hypothetical protein